MMESKKSLPNTVLIVEDERCIINTLSLVLENAGYHVLIASDSLTALQLIMVRKINLMILDLELSGLSGFKLLDELEKRNIYLPTILLIGLLDTADRREIFKRATRLKKPFEPADILRCIRSIEEKKVLK